MSRDTTIPPQFKSTILNAFAQGKTNEQTFKIMRNAGHQVTYQQVMTWRTHQVSQFNDAFAMIFRS